MRCMWGGLKVWRFALGDGHLMTGLRVKFTTITTVPGVPLSSRMIGMGILLRPWQLLVREVLRKREYFI